MANFSEEMKLTVWNKAKTIPNFDSAKYRQDPCGAWMCFSDYGNTESDYGWEIDHIFPEAKGGTDHIDNLCAMNWKNNRSKDDDFPKFQTATTSKGNENVDSVKEVDWGSETIKKIKKLYPHNQYV